MPDNFSESTKAFLEEDGIVIKWNSGVLQGKATA